MEKENHCTALSCKTNRPKILHYADSQKRRRFSMERRNYHARSCWARIGVVGNVLFLQAPMQNRQLYADSAPTSLLAVVHLIHDSFFSDEIEMRDRTFARTCFTRFMAEEGTINVLFYTAKRLREGGGDSGNGKLPPLLSISGSNVTLKSAAFRL